MDVNGNFVFIVGSPRSGTTILGEILNKHCQISQWFEPYFVWDHYFRTTSHDERTAEDAVDEVIKQIHTDFCNYKRKRECLILIDKSPRNSLKIPFILKIFPEARFIHLLRDGRDVTLSIKKEWLRRRNIVENSFDQGNFDYREAFREVKRFLETQPYVKDKIRALWFETRGHLVDKSKHLNRLRWNGEVGWGPRFKDWEKIYRRSSLLEFNAYQWLNCVNSIERSWSVIDESKSLVIKYEDLITNPIYNITRILHFLGVKGYHEYFKSMPKLKSDNFDKWKIEFTRDDLEQIDPILTSKLIELSYASTEEWIRGS